MSPEMPKSDLLFIAKIMAPGVLPKIPGICLVCNYRSHSGACENNQDQSVIAQKYSGAPPETPATEICDLFDTSIELL